MKIDVLDKGFVELVDKLGGDLTTVNSARVSFGKRKKTLSKKDENLVEFLAKERHFSPFRHTVFQFHIKCPEFVARQWYKHIVGSDYTFKDTAWNEISGRYVVLEDEFYVPSFWRKQSLNNKQASLNEEIYDTEKAQSVYEKSLNKSYESYRKLISLGVAKEIARGVIPISFYTEFYWTASLQAVQNFIVLRDDKHAQWEIKEYAVALKTLVKEIAPVSLEKMLECSK